MNEIKSFKNFCKHSDCFLSHQLIRNDITERFFCSFIYVDWESSECLFISLKGRIRKSHTKDMVHLAFLLRFLKKHGFKK